MNILAIDTGLRIGFAVLQDDGVTLTFGTLPHLELSKLGAIALGYDVQRIVIEEPLFVGRGILTQDLRHIQQEILDIFPDATVIDASAWKNSKWYSVPLPLDLETKHEKDAVRIGYWFIDRKLGGKISL